MGPDTGPSANWQELINNPEWTLVEVSESNFSKPRPMMVFNLHLKRKPRYIVTYIILPLLVLIALNGCVFLLPGQSGEKTSYAITVFLSFVVFSTIVQETLPVNSENVCYLSVFVTMQIIESAVITIVTILLVRLESCTGHIPKAIISIAKCFDSWQYRPIKDVRSKKSNVILEKQKLTALKEFKHSVDSEDTATICSDTLDKGDMSRIIIQLDWLFFFAFFFFNVTCTSVFFGMVL
ncbi:hypothetical protein DPMN_056738 [Dreissena polymorpha]|uniref:Neurotransmitter-gated ion-channel transmembrane domain-containing protein n=2 Tax=Dreissena polymorpha TaxID=45954 RepID=A0A9D4CV41_DREPO|nr:hypothetical protein DPMN_056738 [Dreissena polymorpha]